MCSTLLQLPTNYACSKALLLIWKLIKGKKSQSCDNYHFKGVTIYKSSILAYTSSVFACWIDTPYEMYWTKKVDGLLEVVPQINTPKGVGRREWWLDAMWAGRRGGDRARFCWKHVCFSPMVVRCRGHFRFLTMWRQVCYSGLLARSPFSLRGFFCSFVCLLVLIVPLPNLRRMSLHQARWWWL